MNGTEVASAIESLLAATSASAALAAPVGPVAELAQWLGVCERTVRNMVKAGYQDIVDAAAQRVGVRGLLVRAIHRAIARGRPPFLGNGAVFAAGGAS